MNPDQVKLRNKIKKVLGDDDFISVDIVEENNKQYLRLARFFVNEGERGAVVVEITSKEWKHEI